MTTKESTSNSFLLPQHPQNARNLESEESQQHSCAPPPPQLKSYFNPLTNETAYMETEVNVVEIGILFNYEITHANDITWEDPESIEAQEDSTWIGDALDKTGDFFGNLFGGDDEEEEEGEGASTGETSSTTNIQLRGNEQLVELEQAMAAKVWENILDSKDMMWIKNEDDEWECTGLVIDDNDDDKKQKRRQLEGEDVLDTAEDSFTETDTIVDSTALDTTLDGGPEDLSDTATIFTGTKLLGLTYEPLDVVNYKGCDTPATTCTSITGAVSVAYAGVNEYGVIQTIVQQLKSTMEDDTFIPSENPAQTVSFRSSSGSTSIGPGEVLSLETSRGTEPEENDDLSRYGTLFVCLVGILGVGVIAAMYFRRKKRTQREKEMNEAGVEELGDDDEANLALAEEGETDTVGNKTEPEGNSSDSPGVDMQAAAAAEPEVEVDIPDGDSVVDQLELDVPAADSGEVEISYRPKKDFDVAKEIGV